MESERQVGAQDERDKSRARIARRLKQLYDNVPEGWSFRTEELRLHLVYLDGRAKRYGRRPGGLGKQPKQTKAK